MLTENNHYNNQNSFSISNWIGTWLQKIKQVATQRAKLFLLVSVLGGLLGLLYSFIKPVRYKAEITFMVEESKGLGGGLLSSLSGQLGMDIGSLSGAGNSIISGDNMLQLLKSSALIKECLKTPYQNNINYCLADRYADVYGLRKRWENNSNIGRPIFFAQAEKDSRLQDSLLKTIIKVISEKELSVSKPDKKMGFFTVVASTKDEMLSKLLSERILHIATEFYVNTKVGRLKSNIARLEKRTDSISNLLNKRTYAATADARLLLNVNPADVNAPVYSEISQRDKIVLSTIYAELMKNLEVSKVALAQETPTIQITDSPVLPLEKEELKWYKGLVVGLFAPVILLFIFFLL